MVSEKLDEAILGNKVEGGGNRRRGESGFAPEVEQMGPRAGNANRTNDYKTPSDKNKKNQKKRKKQKKPKDKQPRGGQGKFDGPAILRDAITGDPISRHGNPNAKDKGPPWEAGRRSRDEHIGGRKNKPGE